MRVLLVEDDSATAQSIALMLKAEGMNVYVTDLGEEAINLAKLYDYDFILLDIFLPDINGFQVLTTLRGAKIKTPIMIVSGLAATDFKVKGLRLGADDYLTKPFHKDELVARMYAIMRRFRGRSESVLYCANLCVNLDKKIVTICGKHVALTGRGYQILELLALRRGTTTTKDMVLNHLYGGIDAPDLKIIDVFVCKLRKKIAAHADGSNFIETIWGRGYVLREPETEKIESL
jgi:two-component system cell cycle response regulator CtrA